MTKALEGIRVVDLSHVLAAPTCTMFLADLGAEVIHIEPKQGGDAREIGPYVGGDHDINKNSYFISLNRAGHQAAINILAALMDRERTGRGQHLDCSMVDGLFAVLENAVARYTVTGVVPGPLGVRTHRSHRSRDSKPETVPGWLQP